MEAIDNKVYFFLMISLINTPSWGFTVRANKKELWKEVKRVLESQELERCVTLFFLNRKITN